MRLFIALLFLISSVATADVRIEETGECHIPQDDNDADIEIKTQCGDFAIYVRVAGKANAKAQWSMKGLNSSFLADRLDDGEYRATFQYDSTGNDIPCNIVTNGDTYESNNWTANVKLARVGSSSYDVDVTMYCYNGIAQ